MRYTLNYLYSVSSFLFEPAIYIYLFPVNFGGLLLFFSLIHVLLEGIAEHFDEGIPFLLRLRLGPLLQHVNFCLHHSFPSGSVFVEDEYCFALSSLDSAVECFRADLFSIDAVGYLQKCFQIVIWHLQHRPQFSRECILFHQESLQVEVDHEFIVPIVLHTWLREGVEQTLDAHFVLLDILQHGQIV